MTTERPVEKTADGISLGLQRANNNVEGNTDKKTKKPESQPLPQSRPRGNALQPKRESPRDAEPVSITSQFVNEPGKLAPPAPPPLPNGDQLRLARKATPILLAPQQTAPPPPKSVEKSKKNTETFKPVTTTTTTTTKDEQLRFKEFSLTESTSTECELVLGLLKKLFFERTKPA